MQPLQASSHTFFEKVAISCFAPFEIDSSTSEIGREYVKNYSVEVMKSNIRVWSSAVVMVASLAALVFMSYRLYWLPTLHPQFLRQFTITIVGMGASLFAFARALQIPCGFTPSTLLFASDIAIKEGKEDDAIGAIQKGAKIEDGTIYQAIVLNRLKVIDYLNSIRPLAKSDIYSAKTVEMFQKIQTFTGQNEISEIQLKPFLTSNFEDIDPDRVKLMVFLLKNYAKYTKPPEDKQNFMQYYNILKEIQVDPAVKYTDPQTYQKYIERLGAIKFLDPWEFRQSLYLLT